MKILANPAFSNKAANPYNALLYQSVMDNGGMVEEYTHKKLVMNKYDIVHYHWPDGYINHPSRLKTFFRMTILLASIFITRLRGTAIVWTVHNIFPHDAYYPILAKKFLTFFSHRCRGLIFLSGHSRTEFFKIYPPRGNTKTVTSIILHGHYKDAYPAKMPQEEARQKLNLPVNASILLFFGQIKPYKNIGALLETFSKANLENTHLIIAGKPSDVSARALVENAAAENINIHPFLSFIPDSDIPLYMSAANLVVLPYKSILNSGAVLLALSYDVPVLVPSLGSMLEMQTQAGGEWVVTYNGDLGADDLTDALKNLPMNNAFICDLSAYEWDGIGKKTIGLYKAASQLAH